jgi:hypothetical protein
MTLEDFQWKVVVGDNMRGRFNVNAELRRGVALSVILINLVLDHIINKLDIRWNVSTSVVQRNAYANDVVIISMNLKSLE